MSAYPPKDLNHRWEHSLLTPEQAVGQLIQHLLALYERLIELEKRLRQVEQHPRSL